MRMFRFGLIVTFGLGAAFAASAQNLNDGGVEAAPDASASASKSKGPEIFSAYVGSDGSLRSATGVKSATTPVDVAGSFEVVFKKNVSGCIYSGVPASFNIVMQMQPRSGNKKAVYVFTENLSGTGTPVPFYITVICN